MKALYGDTWYCTATASFPVLYCTIRKRTAVASSLLSSTHVCLFLICLFTLKIALLKRWYKTQSTNRMSCVYMKQLHLLNPTCTSHLHIKITLHLHDEGRGTNTWFPPPSLFQLCRKDPVKLFLLLFLISCWISANLRGACTVVPVMN